MDASKIMQMIEGLKGSLAELESAINGGEESQGMEEAPEMESESPEMGESESEGGRMPPMLKKFMKG